MNNEQISYLLDANFNVTAAIDDTGDDDTGDVVERYTHSPYGEATVLYADFSLDSSNMGDGISDIGNEFLYTGRRLDPETGLQYSRYRYYHAQVGRFLTRDPITYRGGMNLYQYVGGMPVKGTDPSGLYKVRPIDDYILLPPLNAEIVRWPHPPGEDPYGRDRRIFCCTEKKQVWKARGYTSPADCICACQDDYHSFTSGAVGVGGGIVAVGCSNPIGAAVATCVGVGAGSYNLFLPAGCKDMCTGWVCTKKEWVPVPHEYLANWWTGKKKGSCHDIIPDYK